jgi:hypothetical protein
VSLFTERTFTRQKLTHISIRTTNIDLINSNVVTFPSSNHFSMIFLSTRFITNHRNRSPIYAQIRFLIAENKKPTQEIIHVPFNCPA